MNHLDEFLRKVESRAAVVGVVGLGYVGLPVAVAFAEAGFSVLGVDVDAGRVRSVEEGRSYLVDIDDKQIGALRSAGRLRADSSYGNLEAADAVLLSLPTPLADGAPDLSMVVAGAEATAAVLKPGALVVLESTTYPGTTEELVRPLLDASGMRAGEDFFLAYSPERIDPGNESFPFAEIPKLVGGFTEDCTKAAASLYGQVVTKVVAVSTPREAELAKLVENTFRHVNIALVNELAVYARDMDIDIWDVIEAASTKPFGFMPFWPGPGWGGHCVPLDPAYLSWRIRKEREHEVRFVELAHQINAQMPRYVVERVTLLLNERSKAVRGAKILGIGIAYKGGTEDTRGSPGLKVLTELTERGAEVAYHDPLIEELTIGSSKLRSVPLDPKALQRHDLVVVLVPQRGVDWEMVATRSPAVFDCCNALGKRGGNVVRL